MLPLSHDTNSCGLIPLGWIYPISLFRRNSSSTNLTLLLLRDTSDPLSSLVSASSFRESFDCCCFLGSQTSLRVILFDGSDFLEVFGLISQNILYPASNLKGDWSHSLVTLQNYSSHSTKLKTKILYWDRWNTIKLFYVFTYLFNSWVTLLGSVSTTTEPESPFPLPLYLIKVRIIFLKFLA